VRLALIAVGRMKSGPERELVERYRQRIDAMGKSLGVGGLDIVEIPESRARREGDRRAEEAAAILARAGDAALVLFDERGKSPSSEAFAAMVGEMRDLGTPGIAFVIGGPDGLDQSLNSRASRIVAFGALTIPHQFVRALVAEQVYRALTILSGHPYHRVGQTGS
jgi:23S rRNA (pseudouridine1915-N3)-methyltransferase